MSQKTAALIMFLSIVALSLVIILILVGGTYTEEKGNVGKPMNQQTGQETVTCDSTSLGFNILSAEYIGNDIQIELENQGTYAIQKLQVVMVGEKEEETLTLAETVPSSGAKTIHLTPDPMMGKIEQVKLAPVLTIGSNSGPCLNKEKTFLLQ
jgi:hypothetical protein